LTKASRTSTTDGGSWKNYLSSRYRRQIQDTRLNPASLLNCIRRAKSASGCQNAELMKLTFLRPYLADATFSNARFTSLLRDTRPASLRQKAGFMKFAFLKCCQTNAAISNARFASLLSRDTRPASQSQNARAASVLQNVNSVSLNLASLRLASRSCDARCFTPISSVSCIPLDRALYSATLLEHDSIRKNTRGIT